MLMLSKRYESTDVDRTWLHVPSGTLWSTSSDTHQVSEVVEIQKRDQDIYTILNRISLTIWTICAFRVQKPSSVILSQKYFKEFKRDVTKVPKEPEAVFLKSASFLSFTDENFKCLTEIKILPVQMSDTKIQDILHRTRTCLTKNCSVWHDVSFCQTKCLTGLKSFQEVCWSQKGYHVINPKNYNFNKFQHGKFLCSRNATNQLKSNVELGYMYPQGNSGPPTVTLTKWLKWCVHVRYMKVLSVTVSTFKRRMEKNLGERRDKWGAMHRLVVSFCDCFTVALGGLMYYMEGGRGLVVLPLRHFGRICAELWYSGPTGRKTLTTGQFLFLTSGYWNGIENITNYFEN